MSQLKVTPSPMLLYYCGGGARKNRSEKEKKRGDEGPSRDALFIDLFNTARRERTAEGLQTAVEVRVLPCHAYATC